MKNIEAYNKFWVALTAPLGVLLVCLAPTDIEAAFVMTTNEWYMVLVAFASAIGVRQVRNK